MSGVPALHSKLKADAKAQGYVLFKSAYACKRGHVGEWYVRDGKCVQCERARARAKASTEKGRASAKSRLMRYREKNAEKIKLKAKLPENRAKILKQQKAWRERCPEKHKALVARYVSKNPDRVKALVKRGRQRRFQENPLTRVIEMARLAVCNSLKRRDYKKTNKTVEILGCSFEFFKEHIERQFLNGMSWDNRREWHIDHIVPLSSAKTKEDVIALNHFTNLRPLFAADNRKKGDKILYLI